jgi:hypothetical protein
VSDNTMTLGSEAATKVCMYSEKKLNQQVYESRRIVDILIVKGLAG